MICDDCKKIFFDGLEVIRTDTPFLAKLKWYGRLEEIPEKREAKFEDLLPILCSECVSKRIDEFIASQHE